MPANDGTDTVASRFDFRFSGRSCLPGKHKTIGPDIRIDFETVFQLSSVKHHFSNVSFPPRSGRTIMRRWREGGGRNACGSNGFFTDSSNMRIRCVCFLFADPVKRIEFERIERLYVRNYGSCSVEKIRCDDGNVCTCPSNTCVDFIVRPIKMFILSKLLFLQSTFILTTIFSDIS